MTTESAKTILITSARTPLALEIARLFHASGHRIITAETMYLHVCRFSNAVSKNYHVPSPRNNSKEFIKTLINIINIEKVDLIIPVFEEEFYITRNKHLLPSFCEIFAPPFEMLNQLHNKWLFTKTIEEMGLPVPKTHLIKSQGDLKVLDPERTYALKACYSRASINLKKILPHEKAPLLHIESFNPWIAQEWVEGTQYCSYSVCKEGKIQAHSVYPVGHTVGGQGCVVFKSIDHPAIYRWVQNVVKKLNYTGQIAFDLIEENSGRIMAIECNPRATNGALLFAEEKDFSKAFLSHLKQPLVPKVNTKKQISMGMLIYGWRQSSCPNNSFKKFFWEFISAKDPAFNTKDLMPLLAQPLIMIELLINSLKSHLPLPAFFNYDCEWNGQELMDTQTPHPSPKKESKKELVGTPL